jgi:predicted nuclease of predicted toxin-antitoxin system
MSLLIDENLSPRLPRALRDIFPASLHVKDPGLEATDDDEIWAYAEQHGLTVVTKDLDYQQMSLERGQPPKVILIRRGNCPSTEVEALIRSYSDEIRRFLLDEETALLFLP